jgi:hypothetical protein
MSTNNEEKAVKRRRLSQIEKSRPLTAAKGGDDGDDRDDEDERDDGDDRDDGNRSPRGQTNVNDEGNNYTSVQPIY